MAENGHFRAFSFKTLEQSSYGLARNVSFDPFLDPGKPQQKRRG